MERDKQRLDSDMTLRELISDGGSWFHQGWCKLVLIKTDGCIEEYGYKGWNWWDLTIGQTVFTIFIILVPLYIVLFGKSFSVNNIN